MQREGAAKWVAVAGIAVLVGIVVVLVLAALQHARPEAVSGEAEPVPTFTLGVQTPTPTPTPTQAAAPSLEQTRMLGLGSEVWWRATAGSCTGPAPLIERSYDQGATWTDVTPTYRGIAQVQTLEAFSARDAEIVAAVADCEPQALRTYTRGEFWDPYPDVLAASRYIDPSDPGSVNLPSGPVPAPCPAAFGLHAFGDVIALVCDGRARSWSANEWVPLAPENALAVTIDGSDVLVAHRSDECAGVAIARVAAGAPDVASPVGCAEGADAAAPVAIAARGDGVVAWVGDALVGIP
ncbi:hypothetical protein JNB63_20100 [Microbacterium trichothecenolyticum]|uniref:hypothetical protein n=1 Tax=Microbacterium trichothecenolyticum TaxID=69370 RepID=UPI001C6EB8AF|nr:hypothetical protein [Microbacterium trichothecenolyticum]MBW9122401.1 hypothetical protein [Microbacterium trichothecenolyticum]